MEQVITSTDGYVDGVLRRWRLSRNENVGKSTDAETPILWRIEVGNAHAMFDKGGAKPQVATMELRPATKHVCKLFGDDLLLLSDLTALAQSAFDFDQSLKRTVKVDVGGKRNVKNALCLTEVEVGLHALVGRGELCAVIWRGSVEHRINTSAVKRRLLVST